MSKFDNKIKALFSAVKSLFDELNVASTDKGNIYWEGDLTVGTVVYTDYGPAQDGDYVVSDYIYTIKDSVVTEVTPFTAPAPEPEPAPDSVEPLGQVETDAAILKWDGEDDLQVGFPVFVEDSEGNRTPAPDGDYITSDGKTIKVYEGVVTEIIDPVAEVDSEPVPSAETPAPQEYGCTRKEFEDLFSKFEDIASEIQTIRDQITAIDSRVSDIEKEPEGNLPQDEFKKVTADFNSGIEAIKAMRASNRIK